MVARTIRLSGPIEHDSIVNGPGLRAVIWTQGCPIHCMGCQNPETWDFAGGFEVDIEEIKAELRQLKGQQGLTFCGGEPSAQAEACKEIADWAREEMGWNIWSFSGHVFEEVKKQAEENAPATQPGSSPKAQFEFFKSLDALIDGPFILAQRDISLKFRGSKNQRILHLDHGEITSIE